MWQLYLFSTLAGVAGANGVPHFVKGICGERHQTPFGRPSGALTNLLWGWSNFLLAGAFLYWSHPHAHVPRSFAMIMLGALIIGLVDSQTIRGSRTASPVLAPDEAPIDR